MTHSPEELDYLIDRMAINGDRDLTGARSYAAALQEELAKEATVVANQLAFDVRRAFQGELREEIDRPKPYTLQGVQVTKALPGTHTSKIYIASDSEGQGGDRTDYLQRLIEGGTRIPKRRVLAVPSELVQDQYGNLRRNEVKRLMAEAKRMRGRGKKAKQARAEKEYLFANKQGIWLRYANSRKITMLVAFVGQAKYEKVLRSVPEVGKQELQRVYLKRIRGAINGAIKRAKARSGA